MLLPDRASIHITPSTVRTIFRLLPKSTVLQMHSPYFLYTGHGISYSVLPDAVCGTSKCRSKRLSSNVMRSTTQTPVMVLLPFQEERLLGEWRKMRRENLALVSIQQQQKKKMMGTFFILHHWNLENRPLLEELKIRADNRDQKLGKWRGTK